MTKCEICGEDMPAGEQMFKFHGYSGPCPKPPIKRVELDAARVPKEPLTVLENAALKALNSVKALSDGGLIKLPVEVQMNIDVVIELAISRRIGLK